MMQVLRGGRLTKVAGEVASYAPLLGRLAAALLGPAAALGLAASTPASSDPQASGQAAGSTIEVSAAVSGAAAKEDAATAGGQKAAASAEGTNAESTEGVGNGTAVVAVSEEAQAAAASATLPGAVSITGQVGVGSAVGVGFGGASPTISPGVAGSAAGGPAASGANPIGGGIAVSGVPGYGAGLAVGGAFGPSALSGVVGFNDGTCTLSSGVYTCSGSITQEQFTYSAGELLTVVIQSGASFDTSSGNAIKILWLGRGEHPRVSIEQESSGKSIIGRETGIYVQNAESGSFSVVTTGTVQGRNKDGIYVTNKPFGDGNYARPSPTGDVSVNAGGSVSGGRHGIYIDNSHISQGGVVVSAAQVTGVRAGIKVKSSGTGAISITTNGSVASTGSNTSDAGIDIENLGAGSVTVLASDDVTSIMSGSGIKVENSGTSLTIRANGRIVGGDSGIAAKNQGSGDLVITAGTVSGAGTGSGTSISGTRAAAVYAKNQFGGSVSITTTGSITAASVGIIAENDSSGEDLTITAASVTGGYDGIFTRSQGSGTLEIRVASAIGEGNFGIYAEKQQNGSLTVEATGPVVGKTAGIHAKLRFARQRGDIKVDASSVSGGTIGIVAQSLESSGVGSIVISAASVTGEAGHGVWVQEKYGQRSISVTATGRVSGTNDGINMFLGSGGTGIVISAATVFGGDSGVNALNEGNAAMRISVSSATGSSKFGIYAFNKGNGAIFIESSGSVSGEKDGIWARGESAESGSSVTINVGTVTSSKGHGIRVFNSAQDVVVTAASVTASSHGIWSHVETFADRNTVSVGSVTAFKGHGIFTKTKAGMSSIVISATGAVIGSGTDNHGIRLEGGSKTLFSRRSKVTASGLVRGERAGISVRSSNTLEVAVNASTVTGGAYGIDVLEWRSFARIIGGVSQVVTTPEELPDDGSEVRTLIDGTLNISAVGAVTATTGVGIRASGTFAPGSRGMSITAADVTGHTRGILASDENTGVISVSAVAVKGGSDGIWAGNKGSGGVSVHATSATGTSGRGIHAYTKGGSLTVTGGTVHGGKQGIWASNTDGGGIEIHATSATGGQDGIWASNTLDGSISVSATFAGSATGRGIHVLGHSGTLSVTAARAEGAIAGISAALIETGRIGIVAGSVTSTSGDGINAYVRGGSLAISAASVTGGSRGIYATTGTYSGDLAITAGSVTGRLFGISVDSSARGAKASITTTGSVTSDGTGIDFVSWHKDLTSIDAVGAVMAGSSGTGIDVHAVSGKDVILNAATVSAGGHGIDVSSKSMSGVVSITSTGTVTSENQFGIRVRGESEALVSNPSPVELSINVEDVVSRKFDGIHVIGKYHAGGLDLRARDVTAGSFGVGIFVRWPNAENPRSSGDASIHARNVTGAVGMIVRSSAGHGDISIEAASVTGLGAQGMRVQKLGGGSISITTTGSVSGKTFGIDVVDGPNSSGVDITITAASVSGGTSAIRARHLGSGTLSIAATGHVSGSGTGKNGAISARSRKGDISISASDVTASGVGILASATGTASQDVDISVGTVRAGNRGIFVVKGGRGSLEITATGKVESLSGTALEISLRSEEGVTESNVTVSVASLAGHNSGIYAFGRGARSVAFTATGDVTSSEGNAIDLRSSESNLSARVDGDVGAGSTGVFAIAGGGLISVDVKGSITSGGKESQNQESVHAGIYVKSLSGTGISINAATVSDANNFGIWAQNKGSGTTAITVTGAVSGRRAVRTITGSSRPDAGSVEAGEGYRYYGRDGIFVHNEGTQTSSLTITVESSASVAGHRRGIYARNQGTGAVSISVAGNVIGGSQNGDAAIKTVTGARPVSISISGSATVGSVGRYAIVDDSGNASVTVGSTANIMGSAKFGGGADALTFLGGGFAGAEDLDGGAGADTLRFLGGSGEIKAGDLTNWESVVIGGDEGTADATVTLLGTGTANTLTAGSVTLARTGRISLADGAADDEITISGTLSSLRGVLALDVDLATTAADRIVLNGTAFGTATIEVSAISAASGTGSTDIKIATVSSGGTGAFALSGTGKFVSRGLRYGLITKASGRATEYYLEFEAGCIEQGSGSGHFICRGDIRHTQNLLTQGTALLNIDMYRSASVGVSSGSAFTLTQSGTGGIDFTQSAAGGAISGTVDGIYARNEGTGAVLIETTGTVTGGSSTGNAAIRTVTLASGTVSIAIKSGSVGSHGRTAILDASGNATVTVAAGAEIVGNVDLGSGADSLTFSGGFNRQQTLAGGAGSDTLALVSGTGSLLASGLTGWENVTIGGSAVGAADAGVSFIGSGAANTLSVGSLTLLRTGSINLTNLVANDVFTVNGTLEGGFGNVHLDADLATDTADRIVVDGAVTGRSFVLNVHPHPGRYSSTADDIELVSVANGSVIADDAFILPGGSLDGGNWTYTLVARDSGDAKKFYLTLGPGCFETGIGTGHFICRGALTETQALSARGGTLLDVDMRSSASVVTSSGNAFTLTRSGAGGIDFYQDIGGGRISGADYGINAVGSSGTVQIRTTGPVSGGKTGIYARNAVGAIIINVSSSVTGGSGAGDAAIRTQAHSGTVVVNIRSGASVGAANRTAIWDGLGSATVQVESGGSIEGHVDLGGGSDRVIIDGSFGDFTKFHAGNDESPDFLSFLGAPGSLRGSDLTGWTQLSVSTRISFLGSGAVNTLNVKNLTVGSSGTLSMADGSAGDILTIGQGLFLFLAGSTLALDVNAVSGVADKLVVNAALNGRGMIINLAPLGSLGGSGQDIELISARGNVPFNTFSLPGGEVLISGRRYGLVRTTGSGTTKFFLSVTAGCTETGTGTGHFICRGAMGHTQSMTAAGSTLLNVDMLSSATITTSAGNALTLMQGETGGIDFTQDPNGMAINAADHGVYAKSNSGAVSITTTGSVTGGRSGIVVESEGGDVSVIAEGRVDGSGTADNEGGIFVRSLGGSVSISAATVTGRESGVRAEVSGTGSHSLTISVGSAFAQDGHAISASNSTSGNLTVVATGMVRNTKGDAIYLISQSGTSVTSVSVGSVTGEGSGIRIAGFESGPMTVTASGSVTGSSDYAINVSASATNLTIKADGALNGGKGGVFASFNGSGALDVNVRGSVTAGIDASGTSAIVGIYAKVNHGTGLTVNAGSISVGALRSASGIWAGNYGAGATSISVTGAVRAVSRPDGIYNFRFTGGDGIYAINSGASVSSMTITVESSGSVAAGKSGIFAKDYGGGILSINVLGDIAGGRGDKYAAIATRSRTGKTVSITIDGTASVGLPKYLTSYFAINDGSGNAMVTVGTAASIVGMVDLGGGDDSLTFGGAFARTESLDGGSGNDMLRFTGGSGTLQSTLLKNWESVVISGSAQMSGTIFLADTSRDLTFDGADFSKVDRFTHSASIAVGKLAFANVSGAFAANRLSGWKTLEIGRNATLSFGGNQSLSSGAAETLDLIGTLGLADGAANDAISVAGTFDGGGRIDIDVDFGSGRADTLEIGVSTGNATAVDVSRVGSAIGSGAAIDVVSLTGAGTIASGAFTLPQTIIVGASHYDLSLSSDGRKFRLAPLVGCHPTRVTAHDYVCSGSATASQEILADSGDVTVDLTVLMLNGASITASTGDALSLKNTRAGGAISFVQQTGAGQISGTTDGIFAENAAGDGVSITTAGTVRGGARGIHVWRTPSSAADGANTSVSIVATGPVSGGREGVWVRGNDHALGTVTISAASVDGGTRGISVENENSRGVRVTAGTVIGRGTGSTDAGISILNVQGDLSVSATSVTGANRGVDVAVGSVDSSLTVSVGSVTSTASDAIHVASGGSGTILITATGAVESAGGAAISVDAMSGASVLIEADAVSVSGDRPDIAGINVRHTGGGRIEIVAGEVTVGLLQRGIRADVSGRDGVGAPTLEISATLVTRVRTH